MAEALPQTKLDHPVSKPVQQLAASACNQIPENYIHNKDADIQSSCPLLDFASIDLSLLSSSTPAREMELTKLKTTLSSCGCFQAINHGISDALLDKASEIGKKFFALPVEEKQKYCRIGDDMEGYGNDSILSENQILDWSDRLFLTVSPEEQIKYNFWPATPENFREVLEEYVKKLTALNELLLKAMALSLNLEENSFLNQFGDGDRAYKVARFNFYPPCPSPDLVLGVKPHADGTVLTFLLQDKDVEGLQVLKDGQWFRVPIIPYAIVVNVGDQSEIMTNGMFKSPVHRVVTNTERERNTLAVFYMPDSNSEIGPVEKLMSEERPRLYRNIKNFVGLYFENYQQGKRPLDVVRI